MSLSKEQKVMLLETIDKIIRSSDEGGMNLGMYSTDALGKVLTEVINNLMLQLGPKQPFNDEALYAMTIGTMRAALVKMQSALPDNFGQIANIAYKKAYYNIRVLKVYHEEKKNEN